MTSLTYYIAVTLDGFIAQLDGGTDCFLPDGDHLRWLASEYPETFPGHFRAPLGNNEAKNRHFDSVIMGRGTYQVGLDAGVTSPYPHLDQFVVSRTLGEGGDEAVTIVDTDPIGCVRALKQQDRRGIWLCGGGVLAAQLVDEIDELVLKVNPVIIGAGLPLFGGAIQASTFARVGHHPFDSGVTLQHYRRAT